MFSTRLIDLRGLDAGLAISNIKLLCVVASMPGLQQIMRECPGLEIFVAAVDQELNDQGYISPGVGDRYAPFSAIATAMRTDNLPIGLTVVIEYSVLSKDVVDQSKQCS